MTSKEISKIFEKTNVQLDLADEKEFDFQLLNEKPLPSIEKVNEIVNLTRTIIFPRFFGNTSSRATSLHYFRGAAIENLYELLNEQISYGLSFGIDNHFADNKPKNSSEIALAFISKIPELRRIISTDVKALFDGDPAAKSYGEIIFCYPSIRAVINHRLAHELLQLGVPLLPRIISEMAHSETGIDIHPGAKIGEYFSIDHGTGVVIGETCEIGNHVRIYQGVTLGAKSFTLDDEGLPIKNLPRHPIVESNVVIYSNANILGRITIGENSIIGGSVWITNSIPPNSRITQQKAQSYTYKNGEGI